MKKIAIVTLIGEYNYGNRLQNYALQEQIKKITKSTPLTLNVRYYKILSLKGAKAYIKKAAINIGAFLKITQFSAMKRRIINFKKFNTKINLDAKVFFQNYNEEEISIYMSQFDKLIVGSDQVWNNISWFSPKVEFLMLVDVNKTISYAASFGISEIPSELTETYKTGLKHIKDISVREKKGVEIIKELTNRDAQIVLDPTLLLNQDEWEKLMIPVKEKRKKDYIVTCFLGKKSTKLKKEIGNLAKLHNLDIINLNDVSDTKEYEYGPSEFLSIIKESRLVITDSFHACIFSIIFKKPFLVLNRVDNKMPNMFSRINTLLATLKLDNRSVTKIINVDDLFNIDYEKCYKILEIEKKRSIEFLNKSINDL